MRLARIIYSRSSLRRTQTRVRLQPGQQIHTSYVLLTRERAQDDVSTSHSAQEQHSKSTNLNSTKSKDARQSAKASGGAMTRRLQSLSDGDLTGTRKEDIEAAGFSQELKNELLERIASSKGSARSQNPSAFATSEAPSSTGKGSQDIAAAQPWLGSEDLSDTALRMLDDAHKKIRMPPRSPGKVARPPKRVDTGRPASGEGKGSKGGGSGAGSRLANARDRSSIYGYLKDESLTEEEREKMRKELKDRFSRGARPMPTTLQGLSSLANERIEDAIARGQFKNLPSRGKKIERDYNASSPFLNTTEYFMNKIIKKQEIVPPWIERQQELVSSAGRFRTRLRADWRRHAARMISSGGGSLDAQMQRAQRFADAEAAANPQPRRQEEKINTVDKEGHMSQISLAGELRAPLTDNAEERDDINELATEISVIAEEEIERSPKEETDILRQEETPPTIEAASQVSDPSGTDATPVAPTGPVFRDPDWERTELSYHQIAINDLNGLTRTYNLMAPDLAKKPYFNLERELKACYADVAPTLPREIKERALGRAKDPGTAATRNRGVLESFGGGGHVAKVKDEDGTKTYGFKQFWRDVFGSKEEARG